MQKTLRLLPLLIVIAGCTQGPPPADPSVITSRSEAWIDALNAKDLDTLVDMYTSDARVLAPNKTIAQGHDAVRAEFGAMIDAGQLAAR